MIVEHAVKSGDVEKKFLEAMRTLDENSGATFLHSKSNENFLAVCDLKQFAAVITVVVCDQVKSFFLTASDLNCTRLSQESYLKHIIIRLIKEIMWKQKRWGQDVEINSK